MRKGRKTQIFHEITRNGKTYREENDILNAWADHFQEIFAETDYSKYI